MTNLSGDRVSASELTELAAEPGWKPYLYRGDPKLARLNDEIMADRARAGRPFSLKERPPQQRCPACGYLLKSRGHRASCGTPDG